MTAGVVVALIVLGAGGTTFDRIAAWAAFVGVAAGLAGLFLYRGLREALNASREANATLKEALEAEKIAREGAERRHADELRDAEAKHADELAVCNRRIEGLTAKVELLQSAWITDISVAVAQAVATASSVQRRPRGGT